jgi:hypothetical protein
MLTMAILSTSLLNGLSTYSCLSRAGRSTIGSKEGGYVDRRHTAASFGRGIVVGVGVARIRPLSRSRGEGGSNSFLVDFGSDPALGRTMGTRRVKIDPNKLVVGLANGWALNTPNKTLYVSAEDCRGAYLRLKPSAFMFWDHNLHVPPPLI